VWEASSPHKQEIKPLGNAMTQKYYTERLLPEYANVINHARLQPGGELGNWILQEGNDGTWKPWKQEERHSSGL
jgi:hypothetical protein